MVHKLLFVTSTELLSVLPEALVFVSAYGNYSTIHMADGSDYVLTMQLGQIEKLIAQTPASGCDRFVRIGKSLIVNRDFIISINIPKQKLGLSDGRTFHHEVTASKEALKALKELIIKETTE